MKSFLNLLILIPIQNRLPNGYINVAAFDRLAAIVGAFTKHMCEVNTKLPEISGYENLCRHIQSCSLLNESGKFLLLLLFIVLVEAPTVCVFVSEVFYINWILCIIIRISGTSRFI